MTRRYYGMDMPRSTGPHPDPLLEAEPCTEEAIAQGCTCTVVGYEEVRRDQWCPLHGRDPDCELEKRRDAEIDHG